MRSRSGDNTVKRFRRWWATPLAAAALVVLADGGATRAQAPAAQAPAPRVFGSDAGLVLNFIKADKTGDFEAIDLHSGDFVYADPPYDVEFTQYSKEAFGWPEQVRLAEWLAKHDGPVVLSNQKTDRIVELYTGLGYDLEFQPAPRMISCNGDRTKAIEVIATRGFG